MRAADLRPNNLHANFTAANALIRTGDLEAAKAYITRAEALASAEGADPLEVARVRLLPVSAAASLIRAGDLKAAEPYVRHAQALASAEGADTPLAARLVAQASFLPVHVSWRRGDLEEARSTLQRVGASGPPQARQARDSWLSNASFGYLTLGMLDAAHDMAVQIDSELCRADAALSLVAWARDHRQAARDHLRRCPPSAPGLILLARAGAVDEARNAPVDWTRARPPAYERAVLGELARLEGRLGEAIPLLEEGLAEPGSNSLLFYLVSDSLALAWLAQGEPSRAARVFEEVAFPDMRFGFHRLTLELRRAQVYRQLGRVEEAEQIEAGLRTLLALADPDHVILRELNRLS